MHRVLLIPSLLPLLAAVLLRKYNADRVLNQARRTPLGLTGRELAEKMLASLGHADVEIRTPRRRWSAAPDTGGGWLALPPEATSGENARAHGRAALAVGLHLLARRDPRALARRAWALRFGHVFPIFVTLVTVFALAVARLGFTWGLAAVLASCGLATLAQLLTLATERQAAELACVVLEKKRLLPRDDDEEAVTTATRAWAWHSILPGILARLAP